MKIFKRIVYSLLGLILTLTLAMVGIILYSEYTGKRFFINGSAGDQYAAAISEEESRLVSEENGSGEGDAAAEAVPPAEETPAADAPAAGTDAATPVPADTQTQPQADPAPAPEAPAAETPPVAPTGPSADAGTPKVYVLNKESSLFHYSDCELVSQISQENYSTMTGVRDDVTGRGYEPCTVCNP